MKLDIDELERKARAADVPGGWHFSDDNYTDEGCAHIEANSPPVTLALIERIRGLEAAARDVADAPHKHAQQQRIGILRAVLGKGGRR